MAVLTAAVALAVLVLVPETRSPASPDETAPAAARPRESWAETFRGVATAFRVPSFWPVFLAHATSYSSFATVVGLWAGPWLSDVHGADLTMRGRVLLVGAVAQVAGVFAWGYADRFFRSYRRSVLLAASSAAILLIVAAIVPFTLVGATVWLALFGFAVAYGPIVTAHGKSLFPPALTGRGITLMNMGTMGGVFLLQTGTGRLVDMFGAGQDGHYPPEAYQAVFLVLAVALAGLAHSLHAGGRSPPEQAAWEPCKKIGQWPLPFVQCGVYVALRYGDESRLYRLPSLGVSSLDLAAPRVRPFSWQRPYSAAMRRGRRWSPISAMTAPNASVRSPARAVKLGFLAKLRSSM